MTFYLTTLSIISLMHKYAQHNDNQHAALSIATLRTTLNRLRLSIQHSALSRMKLSITSLSIMECQRLSITTLRIIKKY